MLLIILVCMYSISNLQFSTVFSLSPFWQLAQFMDNLVARTRASLPRMNGDLPPPLQVLNMGACVAICCGILCWHRAGVIGVEDFQRVYDHYEDSGAGDHVRAAIREGFDDIGPYNTMEQNAKLLQIILEHKNIGV
ncbi:hypothetical protein BOTBODRAFT_413642 [Botryobasidium botryosum FD-172 SS1]|uniref:Uncharacterized protein n=1 Tax=Botryobasidium botryosum (strain FD-172 SS1) TaxID=930990 RepID=A0A067MAL3_BOTB1|nr:hypothetical protein BOTBODRAFT_413642 [Botryobasidium botryosum FD-172 SS1]